jgi:hypothetical protein
MQEAAAALADGALKSAMEQREQKQELQNPVAIRPDGTNFESNGLK